MSILAAFNLISHTVTTNGISKSSSFEQFVPNECFEVGLSIIEGYHVEN